MCLTNPARIVSVEKETALADFSGSERKVSLRYVKARPGQYVICAAGMVVEVIGKEEAERLRACFHGNRG